MSDTVEIELTKGYKAIIDADDYERVSKYKWYAQKINPKLIYAVCDMRNKPEKSYMYLHRFIKGKSSNELVVDHINMNSLDNRKINLRLVNRCVNSSNTRRVYENKNGYVGIKEMKYKNNMGVQSLYFGRIKFNSKEYRTKFKKTPKEAHELYLILKAELDLKIQTH